MLLKNANFLNENFNIVQGNLLIKDGKIITEDHVNDNINDVETMDCEDYIIIPGLFNAHFHGYSLAAKGIAKDLKIEDWCNDSPQGKIQQQFFDHVDHLSSSEYQIVCKKAYVDMVKKGITFVSESEPGNWPDVIAEAINHVGIRGLVDSYEKVPKFHNKTIGKVSFGTHLLEEEDITDEALTNCETIKKSFDPIHLTHCMENEWRKNLVFSKYGKSSVEIYMERGLLDHKTILFHSVFLTEKDFNILAKAGSSVVHCPVSNLWSGAGIAPISHMLEKGVNVCIGTDYASVDIWETMKLTYYLLKNNPHSNRFIAEDVFKMATKNGAKAYHREFHGSIQNGFMADLVFIKKNPYIPMIHTNDFSTVVHNLLMETQEDFIHHVMVEGEWVMFNREILTVDEEEINKEYLRILEKLYNKIG